MSGSSLRERLPIMALSVIAVWVPLQYLPTRQYRILPTAAVWLDDGLLLLLAVVAAVLAWRCPERVRVPLNLPLLAFLAVSIASAVWNGSSLIQLVLGLRALLQCVVLYYVIVLLRVPARDLVRLATVTVALAALQAPFAVYQFASTFRLMSRDEVFGTMWRGASNSLAYFLLMVMLPLAGFWIRQPERRWPLAALAAMLVPFVFCSSRGAYYLAPIVGVAALWQPLRVNRWLCAALAFGVVLTLSLFAIYYALKPRSYGSEVSAELSPIRVWREQLDPKGGMGRLYYLQYLVGLFRREGWATALIGLGPASFSSTSGAFLGAPLLAEATRGAHSPIIPSQLVATLAEFGLLGLVAFSWAVMRGIGVLRAAARQLQGPGWRGFAEGASGAGLLFLLAVPLDNVWELQFVAYYFWGMVGAATLALRSDTP